MNLLIEAKRRIEAKSKNKTQDIMSDEKQLKQNEALSTQRKSQQKVAISGLEAAALNPPINIQGTILGNIEKGNIEADHNQQVGQVANEVREQPKEIKKQYLNEEELNSKLELNRPQNNASYQQDKSIQILERKKSQSKPNKIHEGNEEPQEKESLSGHVEQNNPQFNFPETKIQKKIKKIILKELEQIKLCISNLKQSKIGIDLIKQKMSENQNIKQKLRKYFQQKIASKQTDFQ